MPLAILNIEGNTLLICDEFGNNKTSIELTDEQKKELESKLENYVEE